MRSAKSGKRTAGKKADMPVLKRDPNYPIDPDREPRPGDDLFFSEVNMNAIREAIRQFENGEYAEHELCMDYD